MDIPAWRLPAALLCGYLLGSIPFSIIVSRLARGPDLRRHGTRNPGATNVWKSVGPVYGVLAGAADAGKGAAAWWLGCLLGLESDAAIWAGVAAVAGHNWSPLLRFAGGKGGATMLGALACVVFPELIWVLGIWIVLALLDRRRKFLWSLVATSATPLLALMTRGGYLPWVTPLPARSWSVIIASAVLVAMLWLRVAPGLKARSS
jgi:glycerol-3-phosphate acyltransferase PlsY